MNPLKISIEDVLKAQQMIAKVARQTPMSLGLGEALRKQDVHVKLENLQLTGSFKIRGALNKLSSLREDEKKQGVMAASAGNHAQGVALGSKLLHIDCKIFMPETAPLIKRTATKSHGAEVVLYGRYFDETFQKAQAQALKENRVFIHPYQDPFIIAGQATIGLEIMKSIPDLQNVVVPIGGGGLISGIAFVVKHFNPQCKVWGVVSDQAPGMMRLKKGEPQEKLPLISTIADGIAIKNPSPSIFENYIDEFVDHIVSVTDEELAQAIVHGMELEKTILEGSGAAGLAAFLSGKLKLQKGPTCLVLCGGNIDLNTVSSVIDTGLRKAGRLARIGVIVNDLPGQLAGLTKDFAHMGANVLDVHHDRVSAELGLRQTRIDFLLETSDFRHIEKIKKKIQGRKNISIVER